MLQPSVVGIADRRHAIGPAGILPQPLAAPVRHVERRIGEDVVEAQVLQFVLVEAALVVPADVGVDAAHREVHLGEPPRRVVDLLPVDGDVADPPAVAFDEFLRLHEHAAGAAAGVVDAALVGFEHLDQHAHDRAGRVELAAALAFGAGEPAEEIFVDAAEDVLRLVARLAHRDAGDQVDQLAQHHLVERGAVVVLGQHALEAGVVPSRSRPSPRRSACRWSAAWRWPADATNAPPSAPRTRSRRGIRPGPRRRRGLPPAAPRASPRRRSRCA